MASDRRRAPATDPTLPRALVELLLGADEPCSTRPARRAAEPARAIRPRRLPSAIAAEIPPNIVYRRYPLVTSLLAELDELRRAGVLPPTRRGR